MDLGESRLTSVLELKVLVNKAGLPEAFLSSEPQEEVISASGRNDYLFRFGCELFRFIKDEGTLLEQLEKKIFPQLRRTPIFIARFFIANPGTQSRSLES